MVATGQEMGSRVTPVDHGKSCKDAVLRYPRWLPDYLIKSCPTVGRKGEDFVPRKRDTLDMKIMDRM